MYTVRQVAGLVGIPAATLRAWEQRYGVVDPRRAANGYRLYDEGDIARLRRMASLVTQGVPAGQAADVVRHQGSPRPAPGEGARAARPRATRPPAREQDLVQLAQAFDESGLRHLVHRRLQGDPEDRLRLWLLPELVRLGEAWSAGALSVAQEHLVSRLVVQELDRIVAETPDPGAGPPAAPVALVGLTAGDHHQIGLLCFHLLLRRRGVHVVDLGADVPLADWASAVDQVQPRVLVSAATRAPDARRVDLLANRLAPHQVWVGGPGAPRCRRARALPQDLVVAADRLASELHAGVAL